MEKLILTVLVLVFFNAPVFCQSGINELNKPNIILIMADDMGYETLGCNGGLSYNTPNIDCLTNHGINFKHC